MNFKSILPWVTKLWTWADDVGIDNTVLPRNYEDLLRLESLKITSNAIKQLPDELFNLVSLKSLSLYCSSLIIISENITNLKNLETLVINSDHLNTINNNIGDLINLKKLSLKCTNLEYLPSSIENLEFLTYLNVESHKIPVIELQLPSRLIKRYRNRELVINFGFRTGLPFARFSKPEQKHFNFSRLALIHLSDEWDYDLLCKLRYESRADLLIGIHTYDLENADYFKDTPYIESIDCIIHCNSKDIEAIEETLNISLVESLIGYDYDNLINFFTNKEFNYISNGSTTILTSQSIQQIAERLTTKLPKNTLCNGFYISIQHDGSLSIENKRVLMQTLENSNQLDFKNDNFFIFENIASRSNHLEIRALYYI